MLANKSHLSVLVVDDDAVSRSLMAAVLHRLGIRRVRCVDGGVAALECLKRDFFGLVFMDWVMDDMTGLEVTQQIRHQGFAIPVIAVTANAMEGDREACLAAGMNDYLSKPIRIADVVAILNKWCD